MVKPHGEHVTIPSVVKEHVEALIHCMSPLVEEEPFAHRGHMCTSCRSLCTFGSHVGVGVNDGLITDQFLNDTFGIDTQVNYNYNLLILSHFICIVND